MVQLRNPGFEKIWNEVFLEVGSRLGITYFILERTNSANIPVTHRAFTPVIAIAYKIILPGLKSKVKGISSDVIGGIEYLADDQDHQRLISADYYGQTLFSYRGLDGQLCFSRGEDECLRLGFTDGRGYYISGTPSNNFPLCRSDNDFTEDESKSRLLEYVFFQKP